MKMDKKLSASSGLCCCPAASGGARILKQVGPAAGPKVVW